MEKNLYKIDVWIKNSIFKTFLVVDINKDDAIDKVFERLHETECIDIMCEILIENIETQLYFING